jgi:hypothetical protein
MVQQQDWGLHRKGNADQGRHLEKIKETLKENLADIVSEESIITNSGNKTVKIPIKVLDDYHFRHGEAPLDSEQVGQGDGKGNGTQPGQTVGRRMKPGQRGAGKGAAGGSPGEDYYEAEVDLEQLAALIFEDLGLPRLRPVANKLIATDDIEFNDITRRGNISNVDRRRSIKANIQRNAILKQEPGSTWSNEDFRFRTWKPITKTESNAVILCLMDVSGSMGPEEKYIARSFYFWMVNFLRTKYNHVEIRFIAHHTEAKEVDEDTFFHRGESGGTMASSGYKLATEILANYPASLWNAYAFHFSDGDNWQNDNAACVDWAGKLKARCNQVGYGQILSSYWVSSWTTLYDAFAPLQDERFLLARLRGKQDIWPTLKSFFHKELSEG